MDQRVGSRSGKGHKSGSTKETRASEPEQKETVDVPFILGKNQGIQKNDKKYINILYTYIYIFKNI